MKANAAIENMLVVSTAHITEKTANWLNELCEIDQDILVLYPKSNYGWFIYVNLDEPENLTENKDIPEDLRTVLKLVVREKCCWLCLDRDGFEIDHIRTYEWSEAYER